MSDQVKVEGNSFVRDTQIGGEHDDKVNHPSHYKQGGVECIEAIGSAVNGLLGMEAVCTANAIKYLWRWKMKNGIEDIHKARWYIDRLINEIESGK